MFVTESKDFNIVVPSLVPSLRINATSPVAGLVSVVDPSVSVSADSESVSPVSVFVEAGVPTSAEKNSRPFRLTSSWGDELPAGLMSWTRRELMKSSGRMDG